MKIYSPAEVDISEARLARIAPVMNDYVKENRLPGIMTLLQRRGKVVHFEKFGLMDIEAGRPMAEDGIFRIYSMTKPVVSFALMMLYERGLLSLKDPVAKYIPAFAATQVAGGSHALGLTLTEQKPVMNIHHLLTHTSGLSYGWFFDNPVEDHYRKVAPNLFQREQTLAEVVDQIAALPLLYQPGTQWRYSYASDVLGRVVEVIAGKPLAQFLEEEIFQPLGMVDTAFHVSADKLDRLAPTYRSDKLYDPVLFDPNEIPHGDVRVPTNCPSGGGGLTSTLSDYLSFCNCMINNGRYAAGRLLSRKRLSG